MKILLTTAVAAAALTASVLSSQAAIACSGLVCWHVGERYEYPPESRVIIHPDDWRWAPHERYSWREHTGRGYWRDDKWVEW
jgi:hypothetical protein